MDFWLTKNAIGPGLIGLHWYFAEDKYGTARFTYEARINDQYTNQIYKFLFWTIQLLYIMFSIFDFTGIFTIEQSLYDVSWNKVKPILFRLLLQLVRWLGLSLIFSCITKSPLTSKRKRISLLKNIIFSLLKN